MSNPTIQFRLSEYQLSRGLWIIRQLEPSYQLTSFSDVVKTIYHDYLAKMNLAKSDQVPLEIIAEIRDFISQGKTKGASLEEIFDIHKNTLKQHKIELPGSISKKPKKSSNKSIITSVSDFSPPTHWKE